jgi:hypothetical protein
MSQELTKIGDGIKKSHFYIAILFYLISGTSITITLKTQNTTPTIING